MRNSGILVANDANKDRARAIIANSHRLGLTNTIVTNLDGRHFSEVSSHRENPLEDTMSSSLLAHGWLRSMSGRCTVQWCRCDLQGSSGEKFQSKSNGTIGCESNVLLCVLGRERYPTVFHCPTSIASQCH